MWVVLLALPIAAYERMLAGWLIIKGVNTPAIARRSAPVVTSTVLTAA